MESDFDIEQLKKDYELFRKKYSLPSFDEMNKEFVIEEIAEHPKTEVFSRRIRVSMAEKIANILRVIEPILNPSNAPIFIHTIAKNLDSRACEMIENLYKEGCGIEIKSIILSLQSYDEKKEAEFIKYLLAKWKIMKPLLDEVSKKITEAWEKVDKIADKSYLG